MFYDKQIKNNEYNFNECKYYLKDNKLVYTIGYVYFSHDIHKKIVNIIDIYIETNYRNKKYGTMLLNSVINYCKLNSVCKIILDDMSDNYRKTNNIYLKNGFEYLDTYGPEMVLYL